MKDSKTSPSMKKRRKAVQAVVKFLLEDNNPDETTPQDSLADKTEVARRVKKILNKTKQKTTSTKKNPKQPARSR